VHDFHIKVNHTFKKRKSNKSVYTIECTDKNYHWRLYASRMQSDDTFIINTRQGSHECVMSGDRLEHLHLTFSFMASLIRESVKDNVRFIIKDIKVAIEQRYNFKASYLKCWRAKEIVIAQLFGG
jgi:MuDR family transposase